MAQRIALAPAWVWVSLLTIVGLGLRAYHIGAESFWFDEADLVRQAQASVPDILSSFANAGANGPLYVLLLHFWIAIAGNGEATVRQVSMVFGVAAIPAIYYLGKQLLNRELGLLTAFLLTFAPFHIWYSQDAKMYAAVALLAIISSSLYLHALDRDTPRWWAAFILITWISLSTHAFAALVLAAQFVTTPFLWRLQNLAQNAAKRSPRRLNRWVIALLMLVAPFLPLLALRVAAVTLGNVGGTWYPVAGLTDLLGATLVSLSVNKAPAPWEFIGTVIMGALFLIGALSWSWKRWPLAAGVRPAGIPERSSWLFMLAMFIAPLVIFEAINLRVPLFEPRYMIMVLPFYLLFAAAGLLRLFRAQALLGLLGIILALAPSAVALLQINYSAEPQKEEWKQAMAYIRDHVRARDVIIVNPGYLKTAVDYYYQASGNVPVVPVVGVPNLNTENFGETQLDAWMLDQITDHERAWLITSPPRTAKEDPTDRVRWFFEGNAERWRMFTDPTEYIGVKIYGYAFNGQYHSWFPQPTIPQQVQYENNFNFRGYIYELPADVPSVTNASWLPLTLYWRFSQQPSKDQNYEMTLKLVDGKGKAWETWTAEPLNGYRRTSEFYPERDYIDYRDVWVGGDVPPGQYDITMSVYPVGRPDAPLHVVSGAPAGDTTITWRQPITVTQWQPPGQ